MNRARRVVLIVDDEPFVRDSLVEIVQGEAHLRPLAASGTEEARALLESEQVDVIVSDLQMPGGGAQALLEHVQPREGGPPVIVITGVGTVPSAVAAMKAGAFDFVQKPVEPEQLLLLVERALEHRRLLTDVAYLRAAAGAGGQELVGESPAMAQVRDLVATVAPTMTTVLITGESGVGKGLLANELHRASPRRGAHLVRVNCAAIPEGQFESELFGHRRGAVPGAVADRRGRLGEAEGGTLLLDEIAALSPAMQGRLLAVLESGEYHVAGESRTRLADVRVVATTNEPLKRRVDEGAFRADLYYRLAVFPIDVPPLRERRSDIPAIAARLLAQLRPQAEALGPGVLEALVAHDWPGNVRELRNVLERALLIAGDEAPTAAMVRALLESSVRHAPVSGEHALHLRSRLDATERDLLAEALRRAGGRRKDAAALLGIDPRNLAYFLRKHDLQE